MIKPSDLKTQSNTTFFDNNQGLINPATHRIFNDMLIDFIQAGQPATFVVDNNAALTAWAINSAGNDYTHVLIRPGTFQTAYTINLTMSSTKTVIGMGGSKIVKTGGGVGIQGNNSHDCKLIGVNMETSGAPAMAFHSCSHLIGCYGKVTCSGSSDYGVFYNCRYLSDCVGFCTAQNTYACTFNKCQYLNNCYANTTNTSKNYSYGFKDCNYLINCASDANSVGAAFGFHYCLYLTNCQANADSQTGYTSFGSVAFFSCTRLINCIGLGIAGAIYGYGFHGCRGLWGCNSGGTCTTQTYRECYMTKTGTSTPVADTAAGGYNWG